MDWPHISPRFWPMLLLILAVLLGRTLLVYAYKKRKKIKGRDNFVIGLNTISVLVAFALFFIAILLAFNVDVREFFTSLSIIAAAIAIVSKDYISNAINGMILMFNNQLSIGDFVKIGTQKGKIVNISLINLHLVNDEDDLVYIPNTVVLSVEIINYTKGETKKGVLELDLEIAYFDTIEGVEEYFEAILTPHRSKIKDGTFRLKTLATTRDSVQVKIQFMLKEHNPELERKIRRELINAWIVLKNKKLN